MNSDTISKELVLNRENLKEDIYIYSGNRKEEYVEDYLQNFFEVENRTFYDNKNYERSY